MTKNPLKFNDLKILKSVSFEKGFHFTENDLYTGITAASLPEFAEKLKTVSIGSVRFHFARGDFQKWIEDTIGDAELANRISGVQLDLSGEKLREQLLKAVQKRISEIQNQM